MRRALICALLLLWSAASLAAPSNRKVALVIGNGNYTATSPLPNPPADARLMAQSLREVGFDVIEKTDLGRREMLRAIVEFGDKLEEGGVGLFFYAGHGVQVGGANFLIPVDADIKREEHVEAEAVDVNSVLRTMDVARNRLNLVVLDACRNNPFARSFRSAGSGGLAQIQAPSGTLIAYATAPGQVAEDGKGENSPYTTALVRAMKVPGLTAEEAFKRVRIDVSANTQQRQTPWESSSLTGDFYFSGAGAPGVAPASAPVASPAVGGGKEVELAYWNSVKDSRDPDEIRSYTQKYPSGEFAGLAQMRIKALENSRSAPAPQKTAAVTPPPQATAPTIALDPIDAEYVVVRQARIRKEPSLDSQAVSNLSPGAKVMVVGKVRGQEWLLVEQGNKRLGYAPAPLFMDALAHAEQQKKAQAAKPQVAAVTPPPQQPAARAVAPAQPAGRMVNVRGVYYQNRNYPALQEMTVRSLASLPNTQVTRDASPRQQPAVDVVGTVDFVNIQDVAPPAGDQNAAAAGAVMGGLLSGMMGGRVAIPQQQQQRPVVQNRVYQTRVTMTATDYRSGKVVTESAEAQQQFSTQVSQNDAIAQVTNAATSDVIVKLLGALSR